MSHYSELCGLVFVGKKVRGAKVGKRVRGAKTSIAQRYNRKGGGTMANFQKEGGTTANFRIPSFRELRKVSHYPELCGLFFVGKRVRRVKTSIARKYGGKEWGTTANCQIPSFAVLLTFR